MAGATAGFASDSGMALGQLIYELTKPQHRLGDGHRLSVLIIINNDTDYTLQRSYSGFSYGQWHNGSKYPVSEGPVTIGPRSTGLCMAEQKKEGSMKGITGNLDYQIVSGIDQNRSRFLKMSFDNPNYSSTNTFSASTDATELTMDYNNPQGTDVDFEVSLTVSAENPIKVEGAYLSGSPSAVAHDDGKLYCFHRGQNNDDGLWYSVYEQSGTGNWNWRNEKNCGDARLCYSPSAISFKGKIYVFYQGTQKIGQLWYSVLSSDGTCSGPKRIENSGMSFSPSACVYRDKIYIFYQGYGENGIITYNSSSDAQNWEGEHKVENNTISESPSVVVHHDRLGCFYQGANYSGGLWSCDFNGVTWESHVNVGETLLSASPSVVFDKEKERFCVFHQASGGVHKIWCNKYDWKANKWSGDRPYFHLWTSTGPGAVIFQGKIFVFHEGGDHTLWYKLVPL
ncbi:hypothetical protein LTR84_003015 [Exophiala bonariae]|uniref:PLL-like beta propeller domain-containing protein n=1 Tax=Exophiala bonariae TaxID=1690606 RepID=A0AAV9N7H2_9EURO|nr:hypothetical protein LTR84_003015 [Exophiala bonariae]